MMRSQLERNWKRGKRKLVMIEEENEEIEKVVGAKIEE